MGVRGRSAVQSQENAWRLILRRILSRSTEERSTDKGRLSKQAQVVNGTHRRYWNRLWLLVRRVIPRGRASSRGCHTTRLSSLPISRPTTSVIFRSPEGSLHCFNRRRNYTTLDYRRDLVTQATLDLTGTLIEVGRQLNCRRRPRPSLLRHKRYSKS